MRNTILNKSLEHIATASFHYEKLANDYREANGGCVDEMTAFYNGMCGGLLMAKLILMNTKQEAND